MHDEVDVRQLRVDRLDHVHGEDGAVRLALELVGAVRGAHGDGERVDLRPRHEIHRLVRIGEELVALQRALGAVPVLGLAVPAFERAEHAELALDGSADRVRHLGDAPRDGDIVVV